MVHDIQLTVGDWSMDGHGQVETVVVQSTLSRIELEKAYKAGVKKLGVNISEMCADYEDRHITDKTMRVFAALDPNLCLDEDDEDYPDEEGCYIDADIFVKLYLLTCQSGDPTLSYEIVEPQNINIGGYGLLGN